MSEQKRDATAPAFNVTDIYFVLFRHKWKILFCFLTGIAAASFLYYMHIPMYRSDAKLLIRYVVETKEIGPARPDQSIRSPDGSRGGNIIGSEVEILSSLDLAVQVVGVVGAEKLLAKAGGGTNLNKAVLFIRKNLLMAPPMKNNVISIFFDHPDPQMAQEVLTALIAAYLEKHVEIHKSAGTYEMLQRQTDHLRSRLLETEKEINDVKRQAGIISMEDAKGEQAFLLDTFRKALIETNQELITRRTKLAEMEKWLAAEMNFRSTNASTNISAALPPPEPSADANPDLKGGVQRRLNELYFKKLELLSLMKPDSKRVRQIEEQIAQFEAEKKTLEAASPTTKVTAWLTNSTLPATTIIRPQDIVSEKNMIATLTATTNALTTQLEKVKTDAVALDRVEQRMNELTRKRDMEEQNYQYFYQTLEQARIENSIDAGKFSNIAQVQAPSFGVRDLSSMLKPMIMALLGGIFGGLGLAFLTEFFLDQSVRRPVDIEKKVKAPLFLTIPKYEVNGSSRRRHRKKRGSRRAGDIDTETPEELDADKDVMPEIAAWEPGHQLHAYYESLRDRLMTFFEVRGMNHKPKLVAVTNCSRGAGATSIAAGLAASLSETGDGNVLLVDLNSGQGAAHPFYKGSPGALPDILDSEDREAARVQEHLYWVSGNEPSDRLPRILPKRLLHLVPKLKASDYDYIIFDMPSITETSSVPRLAALMDMVFLVTEADKTHSESMRRAVALLEESKTNVGVLLNKYQKRIPDALHHEL